MKVCPKCRKAPWPYFIIMFVASFVALLTWLTLDPVGITATVNRWWTGGAFTITCGFLFAYMYWCVRVHCRHSAAV